MVTRWVWATGPFYSLEPFNAERGGWPRGRLLDKPPEDPAGSYEFGFDTEGRLRVIREHTEFQGKHNETFVEADDGQWIWCFHHRDKSKVQAVVQRVYVDQRHMGTAGKSRFAYMVEHYRWEEGSLQGITVEYDTGDVSNFEIAYQARQVAEIAVVRPQSRHVVYKANLPPLMSLLDALDAQLPDAVFRAVAATGEDRPVFVLILAYSMASAEEMALPSLYLGLESDRDSWQSRGDSPEQLWSPANVTDPYRDDLELVDPALDETAADVALSLRSVEDYTAARQTYLAVARHLMSRDWDAALTATNDFKVIVVDLDLSDLTANMQAVHGIEAVERLQRDGLL